MSRSWALILPTVDPTAEDSGTLRWKKPVNKQTSDWTQAHLLPSLEMWWDILSSFMYSPGVLCTCRQAADMLLSEVSPVATGVTLFNLDLFGHQGCSASCNWLAQAVRSTNTWALGLWCSQQHKSLRRNFEKSTIREFVLFFFCHLHVRNEAFSVFVFTL